VNSRYDAVIIGSGFSGSLLGWILATRGWRVAIVDRARHPRFAIGESSTPTADFILAYLADRWSLRELRPLAAWGTWKEAYPQIDCGKKRGFAYVGHQRGCSYSDDSAYSHSMMVAASQTDTWSDTHWMRSDVDGFLVNRAKVAGCEVLERTTIDSAIRDDDWQLQLTQRLDNDETMSRSLRSRWVIDAGGAGDFSTTWLGNKQEDEWMRTKTFAVYGHFENVGSFNPLVGQVTSPDSRADFYIDDSAQHHVMEDGWMWMLRFDSGKTSTGVVLPLELQPKLIPGATSTWFEDWCKQYPSIRELMKNASFVNPAIGIQRSGRLSRCRVRAVGEGWIMLPTAYGFVDPLHSTGIAHALSGVLRVAELLDQDGTVDRATSDRWSQYDHQLRREIFWLDLLVGGCYAALPSFDGFCAYASWYFVAAIAFEQTMARDPSYWPQGYMQSGSVAMTAGALATYPSREQTNSSVCMIDLIRDTIKPWNRVGLLDGPFGRRIPHTAPPKYADRQPRLGFDQLERAFAQLK
jgi:FADH2 O2-dependent halogenase